MPRTRFTRAPHALALALMMATVSTPALAVSVNDMVVWSATNQPLRMDIELVDLQGANLRDLSVSVASSAEHTRVGLSRPDWADNVRFKIIALPSGKVIARATSSTAVEGDFVSFMVSIRAAGIGQLQQVASKVSSDGAEPLAPAQAAAVAPRSEPSQVAAAAFTDKPAAKPAVKPVAKPAAAPVAAPKAAPKPVAAPAPVVAAPVAVQPSPEPAELVAAAEADNAEVLADVGAEPTLESLQSERTQMLQQITDLQTRVTELDQQISALNPEAMPESETPTALAETGTSPAELDEAAKTKLLGYSYFSNVLLVFLGLFLTGMFITERISARKR
ncbi:FimV/HubP-related protein [Perlucidibaca aquatica]|uniref:FimV/HubP-related protein n=1 Tax=Perlucidibaca aquatica TaxID=1852776 RepID=UPI0012FDFF24|nr:hypothetical protein [Perlucidibaca aquatica]